MALTKRQRLEEAAVAEAKARSASSIVAERMRLRSDRSGSARQSNVNGREAEVSLPAQVQRLLDRNLTRGQVHAAMQKHYSAAQIDEAVFVLARHKAKEAQALMAKSMSQSEELGQLAVSQNKLAAALANCEELRTRLQKKLAVMQQEQQALKDKLQKEEHAHHALLISHRELEDRNFGLLTENHELTEAHVELQAEVLQQREFEPDRQQQLRRLHAAQQQSERQIQRLKDQLAAASSHMEYYDQVYSATLLKDPVQPRTRRSASGHADKNRDAWLFASRVAAWTKKCAAYKAELQTLRAYKQKVEREMECAVCCDAIVTTRMQCCQQSICRSCSSKVTACPFCRAGKQKHAAAPPATFPTRGAVAASLAAFRSILHRGDTGS